MSNNFNSYKTNAYELKTSTDDDKCCTLKFSKCDDKYPMYKLKKEDLKEFVNFAKKVENLSWKIIKVHPSLNYETLANMKKPDNISKDVTLTSMRMSKKSRIIGYRQQEYFYIVWFDVNHKTC
ncbi:MAG: hypothetical protein NC483_07245 [Ruminococcus sp.]|nr:hypothetical protein [Ruminococcus sp.]